MYNMYIQHLTVAEQLIAQHSAIKMLHSRVKLILEYIRAVEAGMSIVYNI
jgi:COP9 signalosome complex subunit 6